jgi:hypothetical protein
LDAFVVYDVQDEPGRNGKERPFEFVAGSDPRHYAKLIGDALSDKPDKPEYVVVVIMNIFLLCVMFLLWEYGNDLLKFPTFFLCQHYSVSSGVRSTERGFRRMVA